MVIISDQNLSGLTQPRFSSDLGLCLSRHSKAQMTVEGVSQGSQLLLSYGSTIL